MFKKTIMVVAAMLRFSMRFLLQFSLLFLLRSKVVYFPLLVAATSLVAVAVGKSDRIPGSGLHSGCGCCFLRSGFMCPQSGSVCLYSDFVLFNYRGTP